MIKTKTCTKCGVKFSCGTSEADDSCWCTVLPNIVPMPQIGDCFCQACLKERIEKMQLHTTTDYAKQAG